MNDLINGREMLKRLHEDLCGDITCKECSMCTEDGGCRVEEWIDKFPSADRPQEWIPCSERLPSEQGQYLVTFPLCNGEPWVYILSFNKGKFYETDDEWGDVEYDDVTAWMPLPEPWKGADDESVDSN